LASGYNRTPPLILCTVGSSSHVKFWYINNDQESNKFCKKGMFGKNPFPKVLTCVVYIDNYYFTGADNGNI